MLSTAYHWLSRQLAALVEDLAVDARITDEDDAARRGRLGGRHQRLAGGREGVGVDPAVLHVDAGLAVHV